MKIRAGLCLILVTLLASRAEAIALQDPTRPAFQRTMEASQQHVLSAIIINHTRRLALVDGQLVREGEKVGENVVALIGPNSVELDTPGGRVNLYLQGKSIRMPVTAPTTTDLQGGME